MNMREEVTSLMRRRYSALALAVTVVLSLAVVTDLFASPVDLITQPEKQPVGKSLEILDDIMGQAVVEDVLKSGGFRPSTEAIPNFGQTNYAYWIRLHLKNPSAEKVERMLEIDYSNIDEVDIFTCFQVKGRSGTSRAGCACRFAAGSLSTITLCSR